MSKPAPANASVTMIPPTPVPNTIHARAVARGQALIDATGAAAPEEGLNDLLTGLMHWAMEQDDTLFDERLRSAYDNLAEELIDTNVD